MALGPEVWNESRRAKLTVSAGLGSSAVSSGGLSPGLSSCWRPTALLGSWLLPPSKSVMSERGVFTLCGSNPDSPTSVFPLKRRGVHPDTPEPSLHLRVSGWATLSHLQPLPPNVTYSEVLGVRHLQGPFFHLPQSQADSRFIAPALCSPSTGSGGAEGISLRSSPFRGSQRTVSKQFHQRPNIPGP